MALPADGALGRAVLGHMTSEYGPQEVLRRLSDAFWFQGLGCVLGFDWHSSGVTTTACGALREAVRGNEASLGLWVAGGKGQDLAPHAHGDPPRLRRDGRRRRRFRARGQAGRQGGQHAVQSGHQLYHHSFFLTEKGSWAGRAAGNAAGG